jgi:3-hydroxyacyl-[acyl-carrier-protein] dehydratase
LARTLADDGASRSQVQSTRRLILKWLSGANKPSVEYGLRLSEIFQKDSDYFTNVALDDSTEDAVRFIREAALELHENEYEPVTGPLAFDEIAELLPHFNPKHIFIDRVVSIDPGQHVTAVREPAVDEWSFSDFYKKAELIPGFVLAEALAQTAAVAVIAQPENRGRVVLCAAFNQMRFRRIVTSDQDITLDAQITHAAGPIFHASVQASVDGEVAVKGRVTLAVH